jgi:hypothetical protein
MEGFFTLEQIELPFDRERVLKSLVRIRPHIYFVATVFARKEEAEVFRPAHPKTFLAEGVTLWHVVLTTAELEMIQSNLGLRLKPGVFEIARAFEGVTAFPAQRIVRLEGAAVGFFISADGLFLTNYHVMREEIEAAGRTAGSRESLPCRYTSFEVPIVKNRILMASVATAARPRSIGRGRCWGTCGTSIPKRRRISGRSSSRVGRFTSSSGRAEEASVN